jgi:hypothetical protein
VNHHIRAASTGLERTGGIHALLQHQMGDVSHRLEAVVGTRRGTPFPRDTKITSLH